MSQLIHDEKQIEVFSNMFFSHNKRNVYMMYLAARRKYMLQYTCNQTCFCRTIINHKNSLVNAINRYNIQDIPIKALVFYCLLNPRSMIKAWGMMDRLMNSKLENELLHSQQQDFTCIESEFKSCVHKSIAEKLYIELDIDTKDVLIIQKINKNLKPIKQYVSCVIETHGGYHVVINAKIPKELKNRLWKIFSDQEYMFKDYNVTGQLIDKKYIDLRNDPSPPIPGTVQGGFNVRFVDWDEFISI